MPGLINTVKLPPTKEAFINCPLTPAGRDPESGAERFFISSWNANSGSTGLLVDETGKYRVYAFERDHSSELDRCGFYSSVLVDNDTMWLVGETSQIFRLTLSTGECKGFMTGATCALVFQNLAYDAPTGKLLFSSYTWTDMTTVSFSIKEEKTVKIYHGVSRSAYGSYGSFYNGDGTYSIGFHLAGERSGLELAIWNPAEETLVAETLLPKGMIKRCVKNEEGHIYLEDFGYIDPKTREKREAPEALDKIGYLFANRNGLIYSLKTRRDNSLYTDIFTCDRNGNIKLFDTLTDLPETSAVMTASGKIIAVDVFGYIYIYSETGEKILYHADTAAGRVNDIDCLERISETKVLGTPFITQRFWLADVITGEGYDVGRAAPGFGEVLLVWKMADKIYQASYTEGYLTCFDPALPADFPVNPRIVLKAPHSMRPMTKANDETFLYFSSNHRYGSVGCELTKFSTVTGEAIFNDDPLDGVSIREWFLHKKSSSLIASETVYADCGSAPPKASGCGFSSYSCDDLRLIERCGVEDGRMTTVLLGFLTADSLLAKSKTDKGERLHILTVGDGGAISLSEPISASPDISGTVIYSGHEGVFITLNDGEIRKLRLNAETLETESIYTYGKNTAYKNVFVSDGWIIAVTKEELSVYEID